MVSSLPATFNNSEYVLLRVDIPALFERHQPGVAEAREPGRRAVNDAVKSDVIQPFLNTKPVERSLPSSESVTAEPYLASPIVILAAAVLFYISLTGTVPLTYDEAVNFSFFSSKPPTYALWNYQSSNNHVLFTFLQSLLLPNTLVYFWPPFLRLPNLLYGCGLFAVLGRILSECSVRKHAAYFGVALVMISPISALYFVVARGYLLGLLLVMAAVLAYLQERIKLATLFVIFATYTVPTFAYIYPAFIVCAELDDVGSSWRRRVLRMGTRSAIFVAGVVLLYLPVLDGVHKSSQLAEHLKTQPGTLLADLTRFASFITLPIAIREIWLLPLGLMLIYSGIAWRGRSIERGKAHRLVYFAAFAGLFSILMPLLLYAAGLSAFPFVRKPHCSPVLLGTRHFCCG